jgi:hypothetical protein
MVEEIREIKKGIRELSQANNIARRPQSGFNQKTNMQTID